MTLKIYGVLRSRASRNVWVCKELGIPYEIVPVMQGYRLANPSAPDAPFNTTQPEFLAINPSGHIPSIDDNGLILHESLAINLYLVRKHGGPLAPKDIREDGLMTMWALWVATECEPHSLALLNNKRVPQPGVYETARAALKRPFAVVEQALQDADYIVGNRFTVADANLVEVLRYAQATPEAFDDYPRVRAWMASCQGRPAYKAMLADRALEPE
jgi:glutathione S-transferase